MDRVKNRVEASHYRQLTGIGGFGGRADQLNHYNVLSNDPDLINSSLDRYLAVQRIFRNRPGAQELIHSERQSNKCTAD